MKFLRFYSLLGFMVLSGPLLSQTWFTTFLSGNCTHDDLRPMSVGVYDLYANKTVLAYMGPNGDPYVSVCDHGNGNTWSDPIKIGDDPSEDSHNYPQIVQTPNGTFHVFYGAHNENIRYSFTPNPHDPYHWKDSVLNITYVSYPMPLVDNEGEIYLFYRKQLIGCVDYPCNYEPYPFRPQYYARSRTNGKTWETPKVAVERWNLSDHMNEIYVGSFTNQPGSDNWHFGWTLAGGSHHDQYHKDIYHAVFNTVTDQFYDAGQADLGPSIDQAEMEDHCRILNTGVPYSQYDPGYINEAVATPSEDTLLFNNSYIWVNGNWRDLYPDKSIGLVDEWKDGYFYTYSGTLNVFRSRNGTNWTLLDQVSFPEMHDGRNMNHVPVTQPANSAAYLYCKELKSGATDCIMSAAGYNTSGQPKRIIVKAETTHLANGNITKITAFLCDEGNRRVLNTARELTFQLNAGERGHLIGNTVIQTIGGAAVIYFEADDADAVVHINASAAGCRTGTVRITGDQEGHETGYDINNLPSGVDDLSLSSMVVYPNPVTEHSYLRCNVLRETSVEFQLYDLCGNAVQNSGTVELSPGENVVPFRMNGLRSGIYLLYINAGDGRSVQKIVIP